MRGHTGTRFYPTTLCILLRRRRDRRGPAAIRLATVRCSVMFLNIVLYYGSLGLLSPLRCTPPSTGFGVRGSGQQTLRQRCPTDRAVKGRLPLLVLGAFCEGTPRCEADVTMILWGDRKAGVGLCVVRCALSVLMSCGLGRMRSVWSSVCLVFV